MSKDRPPGWDRARFVAEYRGTGSHTAYLRSLTHRARALGIPCSTVRAGPVVGALARAVGRARLQRPIVPGENRLLAVSPVTHGNDGRLFPYALRGPVVPWAFDCWPNDYAVWDAMFARLRPAAVIFSARQNAERFEERLGDVDVAWVPEGIDAAEMPPPITLERRSIDVLEIGRRFEAAHQALRDLTTGRPDVVHRHPTSDGANDSFSGRNDLLTGLSESRVLVCYPRTITHPDLARGVETLTQRYLEGISAGCVIVGQAPEELVDVFGFDPVVACDPSDVGDAVMDVRAHPDRYVDQTAEARQRLLETSTWDHRLVAVGEVLQRVS